MTHVDLHREPLSERLGNLFAGPVEICIATPQMYFEVLADDEVPAVAGAVAKRRAEFTAGRACARQALRLLGAPSAGLPRRADRTPTWPKGVVGSITHCDNFCCAVVARAEHVVSLGVDAELADPLEARLHRLICRPDELAAFATLRTLPELDWLKLAFSAKEAFYKCYYPIAGTYLDFHDVRIVLAPESSRSGRFSVALRDAASPHAGLAEQTYGRWLLEAGRVYSAASLAPGGASD